MIKRVLVGATVAAAGWAAYAGVRRWWETWGVDPSEAKRALAGDELVADPTVVDTRGLTIEAPPEAVWPWLVQMGFGRAGWYSYDRLDMRGASAERIVPEWQQLEVGDLLPTHPDGGFEVKVLDPGRALVVYIDAPMAERWKEAARSRGRDETVGAGESMPPGLAASGGFLDASMPQDFAVSWAFVLEPADEGTRLVERIRGRFEGPAGPGSRLMLPALGFGVFLMTQRHMTGIKKRAEAAFRRATTPAAPPPDDLHSAVAADDAVAEPIA
jgi:hypothetical protein